jgi:hypothetical protein
VRDAVLGVVVAGLVPLMGIGVVLTVASVLGAAMTRRLGARSHDAGLGVRREGAAASPWLMPGLGALVGMALLLILFPVHAGAARAVDATPSAMVELWASWLVRVLSASAIVCAAFGAAEWRSAAHRRWVSLHRTPDEVRRERAR